MVSYEWLMVNRQCHTFKTKQHYIENLKQSLLERLGVSIFVSTSLILCDLWNADYLSAVLNHRVVPSRCSSCAVALTSKGLEARDVLLLGNLSHFKEEVSNSSMFAETLSSGADIFVNDSISQSHKVLASTVGVTCFCSTSVAGFHFERNLFKLKNVATASKRPYFAIVSC